MPEKLPTGWVQTTLGELCAPSRARALPNEEPNLPYVGMEHVEAQTMKLLGHSEASDLKSLAVRFNKGDVLYGKMRPYLNKVWLAEFDGLCSAEFLVFPKIEGLNNQFLAYRLNSHEFMSFANHQVSGERPRVDFDKLATFPILLPPSQEQDRIVAKLNALLSRVAAGEAAARRALDRIQGYRAAVFHAAVTGELTSDWRKTHPSQETGPQIVKRLLVERRARWEEAELKRLRAAGILPKNDKWEMRYHEPTLPKTGNLPNLPSTWAIASVEQLLRGDDGMAYGILKPGTAAKGGVPMLRIVDIAEDGTIQKHGIFHVSKELAEEFRRTRLETNDLLLSVMGTIGRTAIVPERLHGANVNRAIAVLKLIDKRLSPFVFLCFRSSWMQRLISRAKMGSAQQRINLGDLRWFPVPIPPLSEQVEIVREVKRRLSAADRLAATLNNQIGQAQVTRQSLMREALSGKLIPQDLDDEPASVLLNRILTTRDAKANKPKATPSSAKPRANRLPTKVRRPSMSNRSRSPAFMAPFSFQASPQSSRQVRLIRLKLYDDFNSLKAADFPLRGSEGKPERLLPLCLVGLNGSGKSNLIEALSEIFCHVELSLLQWQSITEKQRRIELRFDLEYQLLASSTAKAVTVRLEKPNHLPVLFKIVRNGNEEIVTDRGQCLALLPTRIIGYSSGLNETISIPYFRTAAIYSQEVLNQARREREHRVKTLPNVPDSNTFFMDYDCNALILVSNFLLQSKNKLGLYRKHLRIDSVNAFDIRYRGKYQGNRTVKLTHELEAYLEAIRSSANSVEQVGDSEVFHFTNPKAAAPKLQRAFKTAGNFFRALYKLSLLNPLALSGKKRKFFLREEAKIGQLERPPTISREDRIFSVEKIRVNLTKPKRAIDYAAISDGEHQFLQIFGSVLLFDEPGCVFLFDEPETHFNPQWRRLSIQWLADIKSTRRQELMISTHSPFVVSGCHKNHVFKFVRVGDQCICAPVSEETFGASYDLLLARLFSLETMIAGEAIEEMKKVVKSESVKKLRQAIPRFGESLEKRFIFERIAHLEKNKRKKEK